MENAAEFPKSLLQAARYFANPDVCVDFVAAMRWPEGVTCPHCQGKKVSYLSTRRIWKCMKRECHKQFSVKTGTIFEESPIPLDKWLTGVWLLVNCKNGISSYEIARDLKITQKSAWFTPTPAGLQAKWHSLGRSLTPTRTTVDMRSKASMLSAERTRMRPDIFCLCTMRATKCI
jgi:transposase-like protein